MKQENFPSPDRGNESVAVIGSGIAGSMSAYELAKEGYAVTVIEERPALFSGTSLHATQFHLGAEYSGSFQTAMECLASAVAMKKAMPESLSDQKVQFLVAEDSQISMDDFVQFFTDLAGRYADLPEDDQQFGPPESFFRILEPEEYSFAKNIAGGIVGQEVMLDIVAVRHTLLNGLEQLGVESMANTSVVGVEVHDNTFGLSIKTGNETKTLLVDQVVNAGGHKARLLDDQLGDSTQYHCTLKTWNMVENTGTLLPPFMVVRGPLAVHHPHAADRHVSMLNSANAGSIIDQHMYSAEDAALPPEWDKILLSGLVPDATARQAAIMEYIGDSFLKDAGAFTPLRLIPGVATAYSSAEADRTQQIGAHEIVPGWQTVVPTKAMHGLVLARQATANALAHSKHKHY
jgi:hypothetical protein